MKLALAVFVLLFGALLATAQKKDPILVRSHPSKPATRSFGPDGVKAALGRKSTTASDLAKIEHGPSKPANASKPATVHTDVAKSFGISQDNKNKPIKASRPGGAGHPAAHQKTKTR